VADQAFSSSTNFALALVVARTVGVREFGAFSLVFATYTIVLGISRAVATEPLAVGYAGADEAAMRSATAAATGASVVLGVLAGVACAAAALLGDGSLREGLLALALVLPGLVLQDAWRLAFFAAGRGAAAFVNDVTWAVALTVGLAFLLARNGNPAIPHLLLVWGGAATIAAVVGAVQAGTPPAVVRAGQWLRETSGLWTRYAGEFVTTVAGAQLTLFGVGLVAGLAETGALRGGQVVLGPLNVLFMGTALVAVPEAIRALRTSRVRLTGFARAVSGGLAATAIAWGAVVVALPDDVGESLLGGTWDDAQPVVLPLTVWLAALGAAAGPMTALRALALAGRSLRARAVVTVASIGVSIAGAVAAGAEGAAWGLAAASVGGAVVWWRELGRAGKANAPPEEAPYVGAADLPP
jgi:hypothetical protein